MNNLAIFLLFSKPKINFLIDLSMSLLAYYASYFQDKVSKMIIQTSGDEISQFLHCILTYRSCLPWLSVQVSKLTRHLVPNFSLDGARIYRQSLDGKKGKGEGHLEQQQLDYTQGQLRTMVGYKEMSSVFADQYRSRIRVQIRGDGWSQPMNKAVHITWKEAQ